MPRSSKAFCSLPKAIEKSSLISTLSLSQVTDTMLLATLSRRLANGLATQGGIVGKGGHSHSKIAMSLGLMKPSQSVSSSRSISSSSKGDGGSSASSSIKKGGLKSRPKRKPRPAASSAGPASTADDNKEEEDEEREAVRLAEAKDTFRFRELKENYKDGSLPYPNYTEEQLRQVEEQLDKRGKVRVGPNIFGFESIHRDMANAWTEGLPPPQLHQRTPELPQLPQSPEDLYWPSELDPEVDEEEQLFPQPDVDPPVYAAEEAKDLRNINMGGMCEGKLQRKNNRPRLCKKVDLEEVEFSNVALLSQFISPAGLIKPRRISGLCSKCQRRVARTIKQSRNLGMIPNTSGIELYQKVKPPKAEDPMLSLGGGGEKVDKAEMLKRIPAATI